ncbi:hypothetical protein JDV02_010471 [Purpureocillium takamizusanense]|uniref:F-box domain-containing protein n=1 Tax=Purpureocillium takamizusanense TaxID=2060973 RepID=A0A9Q8QT07_9HYPO|nr:uncharacterized protein JDV02_010471 [Purpureocillium takamizusanense]UNI24746.1 hypothetical protein JDV02_010471 [Purpureocillium takamizusanense]
MDKVDSGSQHGRDASRGWGYPWATAGNGSRGSVDEETGAVLASNDGEDGPQIPLQDLSSLSLTAVEPKPPPTFLDQLRRLPPEVWLEILGYLSLGEVIRLRRTCFPLYQSIPSSAFAAVFRHRLAKLSLRTCRRCLTTARSCRHLLQPLIRPLAPPYMLVAECVPCKAQRGGIEPEGEWWLLGRRAFMCGFCGYPTDAPGWIGTGLRLHGYCRERYGYLRTAAYFFAFLPVPLVLGFVWFIATSSEAGRITNALLGAECCVPVLSFIMLAYPQAVLRLHHFAALLSLAAVIVATVVITRITSWMSYHDTADGKWKLLFGALVVVVTIKSLHFVGNVILMLEYKHWQNMRPHSAWPRRALAVMLKLAAMLANPLYLEQVYPGRYTPMWLRNVLDRLSGRQRWQNGDVELAV